jgi:hypothetical protein
MASPFVVFMGLDAFRSRVGERKNLQRLRKEIGSRRDIGVVWSYIGYDDQVSPGVAFRLA